MREDKLKAVYHQFANKVQANKHATGSLCRDQMLFDVPSTGTGKEVNLLYFEQRRSWLFEIKQSGYFVELYTCAPVDVKPKDSTNQNSERSHWQRHEYWGIKIWHEGWSRLFQKNEELGIGEKTSWQPSEAQFFPSEGHADFASMEGTEAEIGAGFEALLRAVQVVEETARPPTAQATQAKEVVSDCSRPPVDPLVLLGKSSAVRDLMCLME